MAEIVSKNTFGTYHGKSIDFDNLSVDEICIEDIARALSMKCRFGGHTKKFYSILTHCMNVEKVLQYMQADVSTRLKGLLHDAAEAYISDMPRPLRRKLEEHTRLFEEIECVLLNTIYDRYDIRKLTKEQDKLIKLADDTCLVLEAELLCPRVVLYEKVVHRGFRDIYKENVEEDIFLQKFIELLELYTGG